MSTPHERGLRTWINPDAITTPSNIVWMHRGKGAIFQVQRETDGRFLLPATQSLYAEPGQLTAVVWGLTAINFDHMGRRVIATPLRLMMDTFSTFINIYDPEKPMPDFLTGTTNDTLANFACNRFGFEIEQNRKHRLFRVAAPLSIVQERFTTLYERYKPILDAY